jgi:hypothetical protein
LFWTEQWLNSRGVEELAPDLLATVPARFRSSRTVLWDNAWLRDIGNPLTLPLLAQYVQLRELVDVVRAN